MSTRTSFHKYNCTLVRDTCGLFEEEVGTLAVDDVGGFVYWSYDQRTIKQASLHGFKPKTLLETGKLV